MIAMQDGRIWYVSEDTAAGTTSTYLGADLLAAAVFIEADFQFGGTTTGSRAILVASAVSMPDAISANSMRSPAHVAFSPTGYSVSIFDNSMTGTVVGTRTYDAGAILDQHVEVAIDTSGKWTYVRGADSEIHRYDHVIATFPRHVTAEIYYADADTDARVRYRALNADTTQLGMGTLCPTKAEQIIADYHLAAGLAIPEISAADIIDPTDADTGLISGRRAEALLAGEASKARTLSSKTLVAPTVSAVNQSATVGANLTPASLGDAGWVKAGGTSWSSPNLTVPSGGTVSCSIPVVSGTVYVIDMVKSAASGGDWQVSIGGASGALRYWYQSMTVTAVETGTVTLTVGGGTWAGTIQNITCKQVTGWASPLADLGGQHVRAPGSTNLAVGNLAGQRLVGGTSNTAFGESALRLCRDNNSNTAVGHQALRDSTGADNTAVGAAAGRLITGNGNTALGSNASYSLTSGASNTTVGATAAQNATTGNSNTIIGSAAGFSITTASSNTAVGYSALRTATTGNSNTAVGGNAAYSLTTGINNVYLGLAAGYTPNGNAAWASTTAAQQTVIGREAGQGSATASDSIIAIGYRTVADGTKATAVGTQANCGHAGSVALGSDTATTATEQVAVGPRDIEVQDSAKGVVLKSPDGSRWRITINNAGTISGTKL